MGFLDKILGKKDVANTTALAKVKTDEPISIAVVLKGEKHFTIYQDGNGYYKAKHKSGEWLFDAFDDWQLIPSFEYAYETTSLSDIEEGCMFYSKSQQLTKVGTIEFIPSK